MSFCCDMREPKERFLVQEYGYWSNAYDLFLGFSEHWTLNTFMDGRGHSLAL